MGPKVIPHVRRYINDPNPLLRIGATEVLGNLQHEDTLDALVQLTQDADKDVRRLSADALSLHPTPSGFSAMIELLADHNNTVSAQAAKSLIRSAPKSRQPLVDALCHSNTTIRRRAATLLCRKDVHAGSSTPLKLPNRCAPYLMDCLLEEQQYTKYVAHLLRHIKEAPLAQRIALIYQGHPQMTRLVEELNELDHWQHLSLLVKDRDRLSANLPSREAKSVLTALKETAKKQRKHLTNGYCLIHFARFTVHRISGVEYLGCRRCQSTLFGMQASMVYLMLDEDMQKEVEIYQDRILINRFSIQSDVDFDHIHIGRCEREKIRSLCIEMGNETDPIRRKASGSATCSIEPTVSLDREITNLLVQQFRKVVHSDMRSGIRQAESDPS